VIYLYNSYITETKFNVLINFLSEHNQYFSKVLKEIDFDESAQIEVLLNKIPITSKKEINSNYQSYISNIDDQYFMEITSGSTGTPLKCLKTNQERIKAAIALWKERKNRDKFVTPNNFFPMVGADTYNKIGDFCNFDKKNMIECFNKMMKLKPRWIFGPITAIYRYAKLIENGEVNYEKGIVKFIEFNGEFVDPGQRKFIEEIFSVETTNHYGTRECWCIAYECPHKKLHVLEEMVFAEVVNKRVLDGNEVGEIVITSFNNLLMPFLRYNLHDIGTVKGSDCLCGRNGQIIELAGGRSGDIIKGKKELLGDIVFKRIINDLIESGYDCINSFRAEQRAENYFIIYIEKNDDDVSFNDLLISISKSYLGEECEIEVILVDNIPPLPSGKTKTFKSYISEANVNLELSLNE
jgi:phenylacetate-CoA ligase